MPDGDMMMLMSKKALLSVGATFLLGCAAASLFACAPSEQSCKLNQTLIGVGIGAGAGAAVGALITHGNPTGFVTTSAFGGIIGGLIGHQGDESCRQYALQKAMQLAAAQQAAARQHPHYQPVSWTNSTSGNHGIITPLNSYTDPANKEVCMSFTDTNTVDGKTTNSSGRACKQPDGTWK